MKLIALIIVFLSSFSVGSELTYKPKLQSKPREVQPPRNILLTTKEAASLTVQVVGEVPFRIRSQIKCADNRWYEVADVQNGTKKTTYFHCSSDKPNNAIFGSSTTERK